MSFIPTLRKVDINGEPTEDKDYFLETSAGTFISFRELLLKGEDKNLTVFEYQCYMVLLSAHVDSKPILNHYLEETKEASEYSFEDVGVMKILKSVTPDHFFRAVDKFREETPQIWIEDAYSVVNRMAPLVTEDPSATKTD